MVWSQATHKFLVRSNPVNLENWPIMIIGKWTKQHSTSLGLPVAKFHPDWPAENYSYYSNMSCMRYNWKIFNCQIHHIGPTVKSCIAYLSRGKYIAEISHKNRILNMLFAPLFSLRSHSDSTLARTPLQLRQALKISWLASTRPSL
jgi:hypothetical protein